MNYLTCVCHLLSFFTFIYIDGKTKISGVWFRYVYTRFHRSTSNPFLEPFIVHCSVIFSSFFQNRVCLLEIQCTWLYPVKICHVQLRVILLDYTLWPFWIDTHYDAPFTKRRYMYNLYKTSLHFKWIVFDFYMYSTSPLTLIYCYINLTIPAKQMLKMCMGDKCHFTQMCPGYYRTWIMMVSKLEWLLGTY